MIELGRANLKATYEGYLPVYYRNRNVGEFRYDILVEECIIVELKAIRRLDDVHFAQVRSYLKAMGLRHGLLFNFSTMPLTVKRVIFAETSRRA